MKIKESNFVEALSHRNERALEYVMVHYGGLVKSVVHRYLKCSFSIRRGMYE